MAKRKRFALIMAVCFGLLLSSCGQYFSILSTDTQLNLSGNEAWSIQHKMVLPGVAKLLVEQNQASLDQQIATYRAQGINASWLQVPQSQGETTVSYQLSISGTGFDRLNTVIFNGETVVSQDPSDPKQVIFRHLPYSSPFMQGQTNTFTLKGSKVLNTNGNILSDGRVQWVNPSGEMSAVVSTAGRLTLLWVLLMVLGGIGLLVAGLGISGRLPERRQKTPVPAYASQQVPPAAIQSKYCPQCGKANPMQAGFCTDCGFHFPSP